VRGPDRFDPYPCIALADGVGFLPGERVKVIPCPVADAADDVDVQVLAYAGKALNDVDSVLCEELTVANA
jgi:hypothetical protein